MRILSFFFMIASCSGFNTDAFVGTVTAVKQHFWSGCVYLTHDQHVGECLYGYMYSLLHKFYLNTHMLM
jgi:hypothetical protein